MFRPLLSFIVAGLCVLSGCSAPPAATSSDAGPIIEAPSVTVDAGIPDAGKPPPFAYTAAPLKDWCTHYADAQCRKQVRCGTLDSAQMADCAARKITSCDQRAYDLASAEGRQEYNSDRALRCLNGHLSGSCFSAPPECEQIFSGHSSVDGGWCLKDAECQDGGFCGEYIAGCATRCIPFTEEGGSCQWSNTRCDRNSQCSYVDGGYTCVKKSALGGSCTYGSDCQTDLSCSKNVCVKYQADIGKPCALSDGLPTCDWQSAFCRQAPAPVGGVAPPGVCVRRQGVGGVCSAQAPCLYNLRCSSLYSTGTCLEKGSLGAVCNGQNDCRDELYCDTPTSLCATLPKAGGNCGMTGSLRRCAVGFSCDYDWKTEIGVCRPINGLGDRCKYSEDCATGRCEYVQGPDGGFQSVCGLACSTRWNIDAGS